MSYYEIPNFVLNLYFSTNGLTRPHTAESAKYENGTLILINEYKEVVAKITMDQLSIYIQNLLHSQGLYNANVWVQENSCDLEVLRITIPINPFRTKPMLAFLKA